MQLASALLFLHSGLIPTRSGYIEFCDGWIPTLCRDIKPGNILLKYPLSPTDPRGNKVVAKLADFGSSINLGHYHHGTDYSFHLGGTPDYHAPEFPLFSKASDIWSLGALIYYLCLGEPPVNGLTGAGDDDEGYDEVWREGLRRKAGIYVDVPPRGRRSQRDWCSADEDWKGTYSTWLDKRFMLRLISGVLGERVRGSWWSIWRGVIIEMLGGRGMVMVRGRAIVQRMLGE